MPIKRFLLIAVLCCGFGANQLRAQNALDWPEWLQVGSGSIGGGGGTTALYFIDPLHGITGGASGNFYYTDTQHIWQRATVPSGVGTASTIRSIQGKLYAAVGGSDVLVSIDSGHSWQFSGLNLNNANDVYADGNGNIRALTDPMTRFARIDTLDCVATGNGSIFRSSDGGLNWTTVVTGNDPNSVGVFGDPCEHVFIAPYSWGTASLRSTDSGQTWQPVLTGAGPASEFIYGASTVAYVSDEYGLYRSIDDGVTWTSIITVNFGPLVMYVWGPMGEHAVVGFNGEVVMTTTGGDDNLHSAVAMTDSNGALLDQDDTMNVPFRVVSFCNTFSIPIALEADVPGLSVKATLTNASGGDYSLLGTDSIYFSEPILNQRYTQDTMWLVYDPHHAVDTALLTFENHWNCSDWTETRTVIITALPEAQIVPPPAFGGNCKLVSEAAFVILDSCQALIVDSVDIPSAISSLLTCTTPLPDTLRLGGNDSILFTFDPADTVVSIVDSIQLFAHFYPSPGLDSTLNYFNFDVYLNGDSDFAFFEQTIPVQLIALPSGVALFSPDSAVALQRASFCERIIDTSITFTNGGCAPDTIVQTSLSGTGYSMTGASAPIVIPPDSSITYDLQFLAPDTGTFLGALTLMVTSNETKSLSIPLSGMGLPPMGILSMPTHSIDAGGVSICSGDTVVMDTLTNTGCDTLVISNVSIAGDSDFTIVAPSGNLLIPPDSIGIVTIHFEPLAKGPRSASVSFQTANLNGTGSGTDTNFAVNGTGLNGTMILSATPTFDVGQTSICQEVDTFVVVQNIGCDTLLVTAVSLSSSTFYFPNDSVSVLTVLLTPGAYDTIRLKTQIDTTGGSLMNIDTLTIVSDGDPSYTHVALSREIAYPVVWRLYPSPPDSAAAGTDVIFKIIQSSTLPPDVTTLDFTLTYNDDLLSFVRANEPSVDTVGYIRTSDGLAHLSFQVTPVGSDSVVATLHFYSYVAASLQTFLDVDSIRFVTALGRTSACVANVDTGEPAQTVFTLIPGCGTNELSGFLKNGTVEIDNIEPNPASGTIFVGVASGGRSNEPAELSIIDALGRTVCRQYVLLAGGGENQFQVSIENLPSGIYAAQLRGIGLASTREFVKE